MSQSQTMFARRSLDQLCSVPDEIIDVYVVERHIWADGGSPEAKKKRRAEIKTVRDFLINPVRALLEEVLRQLAAPYDPANRASAIGQGWWIQAEFGSDKSHLLSFLGALALGDPAAWEQVRALETAAGKGKRDSIYTFYENGIARKSSGNSRGIFVAVKTLVGQGGGTIGLSDTGRKLTEYVLDAVADQFYAENGRAISLYPVEVLADRFEKHDFERYHRDLARFLKDPAFFDEEEQEDVDKFLRDLRDTRNPTVRRDCGSRLWRFYREYLKTTPHIALEAEDVLEHAVRTLLAEGYEGLLLILDEVSLFMKNRTDDQRVEDEKTLVVLSNRLAKVACLPVWTVCSAQQALESRMGVKNIIAHDRLKEFPLLQDERGFYDIVLARARQVTEPGALAPYFEDYRQGFTWPDSVGQARFTQFFPFFPPAIDVVRAVSYTLTTLRSSVHFMHQTLKTQCKVKSNELITLWQMFDDVVNYEEDPSGTTEGLAAIRSKFPEEWRAYETARRTVGRATKGRLKVYASRCEKILKTLLLYHIARMEPNGLSVEQIMNSVMEWRDHKEGQQADREDNLGHYEVLCEELARELPQIRQVGKNFVFNPVGGGVDVRELFQRARGLAETHDVQQRQAWEHLLGLNGWTIDTPLLKIDLTRDARSLFRAIAPSEQQVIDVEWHGRQVKGTVYMRDLLDVAARGQSLPPINTPDTDHDFAVFISNKPCLDRVPDLLRRARDPRVLFWSPAPLAPAEKDRLLDFTAYRRLIADYRDKDTEESREVVQWVANRLRDEIGTIVKLVTDSYARGRIAATDHSEMSFAAVGELPAILTPLVGQVLDAVYESKALAFTAPAPFTDAEAIKVINGVVKTGDIPRGTKPNQYTNAAENYGYALGIMKKDGTRQLNTKGCVFVEALDKWIDAQIAAGNESIGMDSLCKNFTGIGGAGGKNYGLSRRMLDVYLLCLVREGKLRVTLSGKGAGALPHLDYTNIADVTVNAALLNSMARVERLEAPAGWPVLAPYAAVLLQNDGLKALQRDTEIQKAVAALLQFRDAERPQADDLARRLDDLLADVGQPNPIAETLAAWKQFLAAPVEAAHAIPHLLNALDTAFGYRAYADNESKATEVDDLATRRQTILKAAAFLRHERDIRAAHYYSRLKVTKSGVLGELRSRLDLLGRALGRVAELLDSEAKLQAQLLDPLEDVRKTYRTRFLQAYDEVTGRCEGARGAIEGLPGSPPFRAVELVAGIETLGKQDVAALRQAVLDCRAGLFVSRLDRDGVERALRERPEPDGCPLHVDQAGALVAAAEEAQQRARGSSSRR
jgi:hypothetical protein